MDEKTSERLRVLKRGALFLDRDGTINVDLLGNYVLSPQDLRLIPGAAAALARAKKAGFQLCVITNQQCIGKGSLAPSGLSAIHQRMTDLIRAESGMRDFDFDDIRFCPHLSEENCRCRKPAPGMVEDALKKLRPLPGKTFFIGDKSADMGAARAAGVPSILVLTGYGKETLKEIEAGACPRPFAVKADLGAAVDDLLTDA